ncbi:hypothetical protein VN12_25405 [Pirellula sp. SH-Sr6A]|nr:hypothetical protein VN12_25405 [Pirellula sp. SH-Sr6A]
MVALGREILACIVDQVGEPFRVQGESIRISVARIDVSIYFVGKALNPNKIALLIASSWIVIGMGTGNEHFFMR